MFNALHAIAAWINDNVPRGLDGDVVHTVDATINEQHGGVDFTLLTAAGQRITGTWLHVENRIDIEDVSQ